jgi:hypothetical protein
MFHPRSFSLRALFQLHDHADDGDVSSSAGIFSSSFIGQIGQQTRKHRGNGNGTDDPVEGVERVSPLLDAR